MLAGEILLCYDLKKELYMTERVDPFKDTSETRAAVLAEFPEACVGDGSRLCFRISTAVTRATHADTRNVPFDQIMEVAKESAEQVKLRCIDGNDLIDGRSNC